MSAPNYTIDNLQMDIGDLHGLLSVAHDMITDTTVVRDGESDKELDRAAAILRVAAAFVSRIDQNIEDNYWTIQRAK